MSAAPDVHAILEAVAGRGDLDHAIAELERAPADVPRRGLLAAGLVGALLRTNLMTNPQRLRHLDGLLELADGDPPPAPEWRRLRVLARTMSLQLAAAERRLPDPVAALKELDLLEAEAGDDPPARMLMQSARMMLTLLRAGQEGDDSALARMRPDLDRLRVLTDQHPQTSQTADFLDGALHLLATHQQGGNVTQAIEDLKARADRLPPDSPMRSATDEMLTLIAPFRHMMNGAAPDTAVAFTDEQRAAIEELTRRPGANDAERLIFHLAQGGADLGGGTETDLRRVDSGIEHFRSALALAAADDPQRPFCLQSLALGLMRRNELTNDMTDLRVAADTLQEARDLAGGPRHPLWSLLNEMLSQVWRRLGNPDSRKAALDGLRSVAWKVLLQDDATAARSAARDAADSAVDAARQCLMDNDPADAIVALDGGRALMLFAATEFHDVVPRLVAAGRPELAERWQRVTVAKEPDRAPTGLRQEVLGVLAEESGVLDPPSLAEIRDALRVLDADALVYLVPGGKGSLGGWAVIAPTVGPPSYLALPNLSVEKDLDVERYLRALATRDLSATAPRTSLVHSLETLCDWAWRAAAGPLVDSYLPTLPKPASGRPHRLILVPMGELALIPWAAARGRDGRYAVERVALSQTASARMLCRSAAQAQVPLTPVGLVVGDPKLGEGEQDKQLVAARLEAYAIHQAFYRGGRYVGTRADGSPSRSGAGTADELRDWLTTTGQGAGAMLHLACHGVIETGPDTATSYLQLAGEDRITTEEILRLTSQSPRRDLALAVLAACRTGRSIHGYDEAYSLGTAFLAGGVRSVLSTLWSIPDEATSVLMFMFHHYLMVDRLAAWAALRQAQLWMLDPDREPPPTMPPPLRRRVAAAELAQIEAWAGFVHLGQ